MYLLDLIKITNKSDKVARALCRRAFWDLVPKGAVKIEREF